MEGFDIGGAQSRKREVAPLVFEREREIGVCCVTSTGWLSVSGPDLVKMEIMRPQLWPPHCGLFSQIKEHLDGEKL